MKITLEPTEYLDMDSVISLNRGTHTVMISVPDDDMDIDEVFKLLILPALCGMGFHREKIDKYLEGGEI